MMLQSLLRYKVYSAVVLASSHLRLTSCIYLFIYNTLCSVLISHFVCFQFASLHTTENFTERRSPIYRKKSCFPVSSQNFRRRFPSNAVDVHDNVFMRSYEDIYRLQTLVECHSGLVEAKSSEFLTHNALLL